MSTSPTVHESSPNAAVVIRERIKERRLFEAQFLFGLLDEDDISPQERQVLERELNGLLAVVRDLQLQANKYLAEGEYALARKMHREMERIAVDVPGLEIGKRRIEKQGVAPDAPPCDHVEKIAPVVEKPEASRIDFEDQPTDLAATPSDEPTAEVEETPEPAGQTENGTPGRRARRRSARRLSKGKIAAIIAALLLALLVAHVLRNMRHEYSNASLEGHEIEIKPISVRNDEQSEKAKQTPETEKRSNIRIHKLSVESGEKR